VTTYWTKELDLGFIAESTDGFLFLDRQGEVVCHDTLEGLTEEFNRLRKKGDRLHLGPAPPPAPPEDASNGELDRWLSKMEEAVVSNSLDDSDENL